MQETDTFEQKYRNLLQLVKDHGEMVISTRKGEDGQPAWITRELIAYKLEHKNPRDRLIINPTRDVNIFQCIGQFLWIVQGSFQLESMAYYTDNAKKFSSDNVRMIGAYGFRLYGPGYLNQVNNISDDLAENPTSRRTVASVFMPQFDRHHLKDEVPCTLNLQFMVRNDKVDMVTYMRSQDVHKLLPYDIFIFTMIQEYQAAVLQKDIGTYHHFSGSFHIYEKEMPAIDTAIGDASASCGPMMTMPFEQAEINMLNTIKFENELRTEVSKCLSVGSSKFDITYYLNVSDKMPDYWQQLSLMLLSHGCNKLKNLDLLKEASMKLKSPLRVYVEREISQLEKS